MATVDLKKLAVVDASSLIREPLAEIRRRVGRMELALLPVFFDDLLHQNHHPRLGTRAERVARVVSRLNAYARPVAMLEWLTFDPTEQTVPIKFFQLASPAECERVFAEAEQGSKHGDGLVVDFFTKNAERFAPEAHEISREDLARIRCWTRHEGEQRFVSRLAAEWSAKVFDLNPAIPIADRVRLAQTGSYCRMTMLMTLHAIQEIGLSGNTRTSKSARLVSKWNDFVYAIYGSLCGALITHDNELQHMHEALQDVPRYISARSFEIAS
jgi:hypothetical protein